jgi:hypothetical protein
MTVGGTGTAGTLTITGSFAQTSTGTLNMELGGATAGTQYDQIVINGSPNQASPGGTLNVSLINAYVPVLTNFNILTYGSNPVGGGFSPTNLPLLCTAGPQTTFYQVQCP